MGTAMRHEAETPSLREISAYSTLDVTSRIYLRYEEGGKDAYPEFEYRCFKFCFFICVVCVIHCVYVWWIILTLPNIYSNCIYIYSYIPTVLFQDSLQWSSLVQMSIRLHSSDTCPVNKAYNCWQNDRVTEMLKQWSFDHYSDIIMSTMVSQITAVTTVYSTVYSAADQRKHQSSCH